MHWYGHLFDLVYLNCQLFIILNILNYNMKYIMYQYIYIMLLNIDLLSDGGIFGTYIEHVGISRHYLQVICYR